MPHNYFACFKVYSLKQNKNKRNNNDWKIYNVGKRPTKQKETSLHRRKKKTNELGILFIRNSLISFRFSISPLTICVYILCFFCL